MPRLSVREVRSMARGRDLDGTQTRQEVLTEVQVQRGSGGAEVGHGGRGGGAGVRRAPGHGIALEARVSGARPRGVRRGGRGEGVRGSDRQARADAWAEGSRDRAPQEFFSRELTLDERIELVEAHRDTYGLNRCLEALDVSKGTWHYRMRNGSKAAEKRSADDALRAPILKIIDTHPSYGYRRIRPELEEATGEVVNGKRLRRLLGAWDLGLRRAVSRPAPGPVRQTLAHAKGHLNLVKDHDPGPLDVLSTDFTELRYAGGDRRPGSSPSSISRAPGCRAGPPGRRPTASLRWRRGAGLGAPSPASVGTWRRRSSTPTGTRSSPATTGSRRC